ncbi:DNA primase [Candidatus Woesearchaeota archaeon]|nr:DNA primase [Candidatus Woesearchaeota archaeon]
MGKISPVSAKYIVHARIDIQGIVDRPDVIGAIFGQTEGLLGSELELRELQRSGRIGRIEVNVDTRSGKTRGSIIIPSSLDKAETAIIAAAMEVIQRIGPCNAKIAVEKIEDVRVSKRNFVVSRAKELLKNLMETVMPDSQELADEVAYSVRVMEIKEYGKDRLPAGPNIEDSDEVVVVEGRADVLNLLKHGIKNAIAMNGTSVPETIIEICKKKIATAFVDGDRGGNLIIKELLSTAEVDYISKAPDGKEVEEITKKEIHKALRGRVSAEQARLDIGSGGETKSADEGAKQQRVMRAEKAEDKPRAGDKRLKLTKDERLKFKSTLEDLIGTRGAYILDKDLNILGKVPMTELPTTIRSLKSGMHAIVFDGVIERELVRIAERASVNYLIAMSTKIKPESSPVKILTGDEL